MLLAFLEMSTPYFPRHNHTFISSSLESKSWALFHWIVEAFSTYMYQALLTYVPGTNAISSSIIPLNNDVAVIIYFPDHTANKQGILRSVKDRKVLYSQITFGKTS